MKIFSASFNRISSTGGLKQFIELETKKQIAPEKIVAKLISVQNRYLTPDAGLKGLMNKNDPGLDKRINTLERFKIDIDRTYIESEIKFKIIESTNNTIKDLEARRAKYQALDTIHISDPKKRNLELENPEKAVAFRALHGYSKVKRDKIDDFTNLAKKAGPYSERIQVKNCGQSRQLSKLSKVLILCSKPASESRC
ncbi:hypothetical protein PS865_04395 [Pseudomonas fluorescens]|uniref:hypothetical protein n=1 Tax=Pseudomonas fluorescens TaxID=294 RepID=UPI0012426E3F|nr:hypothetical protein [Pseudomonas fluorescens]VVP31705.1 hypothetical protein PS865_04395 [Pseudomonas fluorescens]